MKKWLKENWYKIVAAGVLILGVGDYPYAFYQILRWVTCISAVYAAYLYMQTERMFLFWIFAIIAVLFNPIAPLYMSRNSHQIYDLVAAVVFFSSIFLKSKQPNNKTV